MESKVKYKIAEIFGPTIQGEGSHSGKKAAFVRFANCNLNCHFCDTDFSEKMELTAEEIRDRIPEKIKIVVLTGGEPLLQIDQNFLDVMKDYELHLETNGTRKLGTLKFAHVTVSPKTTREKCVIEYADDLKLVYPEFDPSGWNDFVAKDKYLQPVDHNGKIALKETLDRIYQEDDWNLSVQLHKMIGVP